MTFADAYAALLDHDAPRCGPTCTREAGHDGDCYAQEERGCDWELLRAAVDEVFRLRAQRGTEPR